MTAMAAEEGVSVGGVCHWFALVLADAVSVNKILNVKYNVRLPVCLSKPDSKPCRTLVSRVGIGETLLRRLHGAIIWFP